jgi:hypothetical protein
LIAVVRTNGIQLVFREQWLFYHCVRHIDRFRRLAM